jgi:hypothetical protein
MKMKILTLLIALAMPVVASASPINLIINGGFEAGNTGFTSDYDFIADPDTTVAGGLILPRRYTIADSTNVNHPFWLDLTGDGQMMVVNGSTLTSNIVWRQEVAVNPFTTYNLGLSLLQQCCIPTWPDNPSNNITVLTLLINNVVIGTHTTTGFGIWEDLARSWFSDGATLAMLEIRNEVGEFQNNDFALDNLSMTEADPTVPEPATRAESTRSPSTNVPFRLLRSRTVIEASATWISAWRREIERWGRYRSQSADRPTTINPAASLIRATGITRG